jgi:hypothetical protein
VRCHASLLHQKYLCSPAGSGGNSGRTLFASPWSRAKSSSMDPGFLASIDNCTTALTNSTLPIVMLQRPHAVRFQKSAQGRAQ